MAPSSTAAEASSAAAIGPEWLTDDAAAAGVAGAGAGAGMQQSLVTQAPLGQAIVSGSLLRISDGRWSPQSNPGFPYSCHFAWPHVGRQQSAEAQVPLAQAMVDGAALSTSPVVQTNVPQSGSAGWDAARHAAVFAHAVTVAGLAPRLAAQPPSAAATPSSTHAMAFAGVEAAVPAIRVLASAAEL